MSGKKSPAVTDIITLGKREMNSRAYVGAFNFKGADQQKKVGQLSGGVISHDRFFLDRIATHMLAFEGDSHVEWFEGNFADYEEDKSAASALQPHPAPAEV